MPFSVQATELDGVKIIVPKVFPDSRGYFMETYKHSDFKRGGIAELFVQDNQSKSTKGVLRGLHFQREPMAQGKLVRCIAGAIFDVAVDICRESATYRRWVAVELSAENRRMLYVPGNMAHGFLVLTETAEVIYKVTAEYSAAHEAGIRWDDPALAIDWPLKSPLVSDRDQQLPTLMNMTR